MRTMTKKRRGPTNLPLKLPRAPTISEKFHAHWKSWGAVVAIGVATCAFIIQLPVAYNVIEPMTPASSGYVRSHVSNRLTPFEAFQISSTVATERLNQTVMRENLRRAKIEAAQYPNSETAKETVQNIEVEILKSAERIKEAESLIRRRSESGK